MISARSLSRIAIASQLRQRCITQPTRRYAHSTGKETTSSSTPWVVSVVAIAAGGIYLTIGDSFKSKSNPPSHSSHIGTTSSIEAHKSLTPEEEKKKRASEDFKSSMARDAPKSEHGGSSVLKHGIAAETNEHKVRKGKFSGKEFDNHIEKHSSDPEKDFEFIEKKEAEGAPKS